MKRRWRLWTKWWYSAPVWPHPDWEKQEQTWRHKTCHLLTRFWNYRINCALKIWNFLFLFVSQAHSAAKVQLVNTDLIFRLNLLKVITNTQLREWTLVWVVLVQSLQLRLVKHRPDPVTTSLQHQIFPLALISCFYHINSEARCIPGATPSELPFTRQGSCCRAWSVHVLYKMLTVFTVHKVAIHMKQDDCCEFSLLYLKNPHQKIPFQVHWSQDKRSLMELTLSYFSELFIVLQFGA